ncbi:MAG: raffinose/stachyose/melibiose transport system permease protein [Psychromonas sp.]|jgi:raffinose/stachyose/melibiose transport system permease protein|uniref:carbohydrate ABC transporter permease n=1 Tax=Psychromonas sp. TaxID=1884585 RepID=UPI0039E54CC9
MSASINSSQRLNTAGKKVSKRAKKRFTAIFINGLILLMVIGMLIPVAYMVMMSFKTGTQIANDPLGLPTSFYFGNYINALENMNYFRSVLNSVGITLSVVVIVSLIGSMAAYPLARVGGIFTKSIILIVSLGMAMPTFVNITPIYVIFRDLGLLDSYFGIILVFTALNLPLAIFFFTGFIGAIPKELEEAAKLDRCTYWQTYWYVIRPLLGSATATLSLFVMLMVWNDFLYPLLLLTDDNKFTVMVSVYRFIGNRNIEPDMLFPAAVLGSLPLLVLFMFFQRRILSGVTAGAVK